MITYAFPVFWRQGVHQKVGMEDQLPSLDSSMFILQVKLRCGLKNDITDVDEPSRCE